MSTSTPDALARIRVLRACGYRCGYRSSGDAGMCGRFASCVGMRPVDEQWVALCIEHVQ